MAFAPSSPNDWAICVPWVACLLFEFSLESTATTREQDLTPDHTQHIHIAQNPSHHVVARQPVDGCAQRLDALGHRLRVTFLAKHYT
jgi:hypothetical protein